MSKERKECKTEAVPEQKRVKEPMRVYLDNCCFNRPFDDQSSLTIQLETEAKLYIQQQIKTGYLALVWSYILDYENAANPCEERRDEIQRWESLASAWVQETPDVLDYMRQNVLMGLKPLDALHVACAQATNCEVFLTVDKGVLRKADCFSIVRIVNPIDFVLEQEEKNHGGY